MSESADLILEWCSIVGSGSRAQFEVATSGLLAGDPSALLSGLELAGHLEVDWERTGRWSANPPVLALPEGSGGNSFLVGARNESTRRTLSELRDQRRIGSFEIVSTGATHASTWFVGCTSLDQLHEAAHAIGATVVVRPARQLLELTRDLDEALRSSEAAFVPSGFGARRLNTASMRYEPIDVAYARWPPGCFEQLSAGRRKYLFIDDNDRRHVCDRWVATHAEIRRQRRAGAPIVEPVLYDQATERLAVLSSAQLPTQWSRAAAFCSGLAPRRTTGRRWYDVYEGVPMTMYGQFARMLEIPVRRTDLGALVEEAG